MAVPAAAPVPPIEVSFPSLAAYAAGNCGIPYAWTFAARRSGPHVLVQALTHGNEVCGAIALDWLLREGLRPARGTLSVVFANVAAYDVPYTTVHTGVIRGGTALNIVPRDCHFDFEFRHLPFDDPELLLAEVKRFAATLLPEMHAVDPTTHIEFDHISTLPGFDTHGGSEIAELGKACTGADEFGKVSFGSEASLFHNAGIPAIICGPGHIAQAHQPNEWVALEQLARCEEFMGRLADRVCVA